MAEAQTEQTPRRELLVKKQHRCGFTGQPEGTAGRTVILSSSAKEMNPHTPPNISDWVITQNGGDLSIISMYTGEIMFNVTCTGRIIQRAVSAAIGRSITSEAESDSISEFCMNQSRTVLVIATEKQMMIRVCTLKFHVVRLPLIGSQASLFGHDSTEMSKDEDDDDHHHYHHHHSEQKKPSFVKVKLPCAIELRREWKYAAELRGPATLISLDRESGHTLVTASGNGNICVWDTLTGTPTHKYQAHSFPVTSLSWHPDPSRWTLYSGCADTSVRVWDLKEDRLVLLGQSEKLNQKILGTRMDLQRMSDHRSDSDKKRKLQSKLQSLSEQLERAKLTNSKYAQKCLTGVHHSGVVDVAVTRMSIGDSSLSSDGKSEVIVTMAIDDVIGLWDCQSLKLISVVEQPTPMTSLRCLGMSDVFLYTTEQGSLHMSTLVPVASLSKGKNKTLKSSLASDRHWKFVDKSQIDLAATAVGNLSVHPPIESRKALMDALTLEGDRSGGALKCQLKCCVSSTDLNIYTVDAVMHSSPEIRCEMSVEKTILGNNDDILDIDYLFVNDNDENNHPRMHSSKKEEEEKEYDDDQQQQLEQDGHSGLQIVLATNSPELRVLDYRTFDATLLPGHSDTIMSVACHRPSGIIASASKDNSVRFWRRFNSNNTKKNNSYPQWHCIAVGNGHSESVNCVAACETEAKQLSDPSLGGVWFITGSRDRTVRVWQLPRKLIEATEQVRLDDNNDDDECDDSNDENLEKLLSELPIQMSGVHSVLAHDKEVMSVAVSPRNRFVLSTSMDGRMVLYQCNPMRSEDDDEDLDQLIQRKASLDSSLDYNTGLRGESAVESVGVDLGFGFNITRESGTVSQRWLDQTSEFRWRRGRSVWCSLFSRCDKIVITGHDSGEIKIWSVPDLKMVQTYISSRTEGSVLSLDWLSTDSSILVATHVSGVIKLWDLSNHSCIGNYTQHYDRVWCSKSLCNLNRKKDEITADDLNDDDDMSDDLKKSNEILPNLITAGADGMVNVWMDETRRKEKEKVMKKHESIQHETEIHNLQRRKEYSKAIRLCLIRDQPRRLWSLLNEMYASVALSALIDDGDDEDEHDQHIDGEQPSSTESQFISKLSEVIAFLSQQMGDSNGNHTGPALIGGLLTLLVDWNTFSHNSMICQCLLRALFECIDLSELLKIEPNFVLRRGKGKDKDGSVINLEVSETLKSQRNENMASLLSALKAYNRRHLKRVNNYINDLTIVDYCLDHIQGGLDNNNNIHQTHSHIKEDVMITNQDGVGYDKRSEENQQPELVSVLSTLELKELVLNDDKLFQLSDESGMSDNDEIRDQPLKTKKLKSFSSKPKRKKQRKKV